MSSNQTKDGYNSTNLTIETILTEKTSKSILDNTNRGYLNQRLILHNPIQIMQLSKIPFIEVVERLFEIHQLRTKRFSEDELNRFHESVSQKLPLEFDAKKKFKLLKKELSQVTEALERAGVRKDLTEADYLESQRSEIETALKVTDLQGYEIAVENDTYVLGQITNWFLSCADELILIRQGIEAFSKEYLNSVWGILNELNRETKIFWGRVEREFGGTLRDERDVLFVDTTCHSYRNFYTTVQKLIEKTAEKFGDTPHIENTTQLVDESDNIIGEAVSVQKSTEEQLIAVIDGLIAGLKEETGEFELLLEKYSVGQKLTNFNLIYRQVVPNGVLHINGPYPNICKRDYLLKQLAKLQTSGDQDQMINQMLTDELPSIILKKYDDQEDDLKDLLDRFKEAGFVDKKTTQHHFLSVFRNSTTKKPITWLESQATLHMFLETIFKYQEESDSPKWTEAKKLFVTKNGTVFRNLHNPRTEVNRKTLPTLQKILSQFELSISSKS